MGKIFVCFAFLIICGCKEGTDKNRTDFVELNTSEETTERDYEYFEEYISVFRKAVKERDEEKMLSLMAYEFFSNYPEHRGPREEVIKNFNWELVESLAFSEYEIHNIKAFIPAPKEEQVILLYFMIVENPELRKKQGIAPGWRFTDMIDSRGL